MPLDSLNIAPAPRLTWGCGILVPGTRVRLIGTRDTFAHRTLGNSTNTVEWCGEYLEEIRIRLAEHQGYTFRRELFAVVTP